MSPHVFTENDLQTLKAWDVNLVRVQLTRNWNQANTDLDLGEYDHWLDGKLDHLEDVLRMNREGGCGLRFVIDLHSPPGGRDEAHDMTMFYDKKYADHFIRCWRKIAKRFKGNPAVWGYDLINEPVQMRPAEFDYRKSAAYGGGSDTGNRSRYADHLRSNLWVPPIRSAVSGRWR